MGLIDKAFGASPEALAILSKRSELIAANLANADTPGYKAKDIDFRDALAMARGESKGMTATNKMHMGAVNNMGGNSYDQSVRYRVPSQPSLDGNTVETDQEHAAFMETSIRYQASLNFVDGKIKSIMLALRGE